MKRKFALRIEIFLRGDELTRFTELYISFFFFEIIICKKSVLDSIVPDILVGFNANILRHQKMVTVQFLVNRKRKFF